MHCQYLLIRFSWFDHKYVLSCSNNTMSMMNIHIYIIDTYTCAKFLFTHTDTHTHTRHRMCPFSNILGKLSIAFYVLCNFLGAHFRDRLWLHCSRWITNDMDAVLHKSSSAMNRINLKTHTHTTQHHPVMSLNGSRWFMVHATSETPLQKGNYVHN